MARFEWETTESEETNGKYPNTNEKVGGLFKEKYSKSRSQSSFDGKQPLAGTAPKLKKVNMIIWKGAGLLVLFFAGIGLWIATCFVEEGVEFSSLRLGVGFCIAACLLMLTFWRVKMLVKKVDNMKDEEKKAKYSSAVQGNPVMNFENGALFFIPVKYWIYILWVLGLVIVIAYLFGR